MEPVKTSFSPGDVIADQYEVLRIIGKGGMGVVYLVEDRNTGRQLALKSLLPRFATDAYAVRRFVREVNAVRRLSHPAIVSIYDARRIGHLFFYTMDYVEGKSLRVLMSERGRLGLGSTVRILALLAHALEHAHQYTIHRDLSPENVMVVQDGSIRLLDFGLAKLADNQGAFTQIGVSLGKWQYNAPEQQSNAADVDLRADVYSLGVMFYEMLSGKFPELGQHLSKLVPGLPKECDAFFEKATAMMPDDRFPNAREFRHALVRLYQASRGAAGRQPAGAAREVSHEGEYRFAGVEKERPYPVEYSPLTPISEVVPDGADADEVTSAPEAQEAALRGSGWRSSLADIWRKLRMWKPIRLKRGPRVKK